MFRIKITLIIILITPFSGYSNQVKITSCGDIIPHKDLQQYCLSNGGFYLLFNRISNILRKSDICVANFETSINTKRGISGYPRFNASPLLLKAMKKAGINIISLANNHSLDMGKTGLIQTREAAAKYGFIHSGIAKNKGKKYEPVYFVKKNIKFSFLSLTTITNGLKNPGAYNSPKVNIFRWRNRKQILHQIRKMRRSSDFVIISIHFGREYIDRPTRTQKIIARMLIRTGADLILGNHSHHIQKPEFINTNRGTRALISYSQGNFISHQNRFINYRNRYSRIAKRGDSFLLNVYVKKMGNKAVIKRVTFTPTWTLSFKIANSFGFKAVAIYRELKNPYIKNQRLLLYFRRRRIIKFMKGFILEENI